jgi:uncharacterized protein (TIGR02270 family)
MRAPVVYASTSPAVHSGAIEAMRLRGAPPRCHCFMAAAPFIPDVVEQHCENAATLWLIRDNAVGSSTYRLADLVKLDERIEANVDGLRIAEMSGWSASLDELDQGGAGDFFAAGVLAVESDDPGRLDGVIGRAYARAATTAGEPCHPADDPWRGLVSALAWVERVHAASAIERLLDTPRPRTRWLGVAACGARRSVLQPGLEAALADREPLVRARAARTMGELGRADLRAGLNALLADPDEDCRFWAAWSAARLGTTEGLRALAEFARSAGPMSDRALDLLLRCLSTERANAFLRPLARDPVRCRTVVRATGVIGDARYIPWLIGQTSDPAVARLAGEAFATITGADLTGLDHAPPSDVESGPNDDRDDEDVALDEDEGLAWPDPEKLGRWWEAHNGQFSAGTSYFLGTPKPSTDWRAALSGAHQGQRRAAALEFALRQPTRAMFEARARGSQQLRLLRPAGATK